MNNDYKQAFKNVFGKAAPDPEAGLDAPVQCHNLWKTHMERMSHKPGTFHEVFEKTSKTSEVMIIHQLEDGRFLVMRDRHTGNTVHIAREHTVLVLAEDVTAQWESEKDLHYPLACGDRPHRRPKGVKS